MSNLRSTKENVVITFFWGVVAVMALFAIVNGRGQTGGTGATPGSGMGSEASQGVDIQAKIATYRGVVQNNPRNLQALVGLGDLYFDNGQHQEALATFLKAAALEKNSVHIENDLGLLYLNGQDYDRAIERFQRALKIDPAHLDSLYSIGLSYQHKGEITQARKVYRQVLAANPPSSIAQKARQQLTMLQARP